MDIKKAAAIGNPCNFCNPKSKVALESVYEIHGNNLKIYVCPSCMQQISSYHDMQQMNDSMSASQVVKQAGLPSLEWLAKKIGKPSQTLRNWHRESPALFRAVVNGVSK